MQEIALESLEEQKYISYPCTRNIVWVVCLVLILRVHERFAKELVYTGHLSETYWSLPLPILAFLNWTWAFNKLLKLETMLWFTSCQFKDIFFYFFGLGPFEVSLDRYRNGLSPLPSVLLMFACVISTALFEQIPVFFLWLFVIPHSPAKDFNKNPTLRFCFLFFFSVYFWYSGCLPL